jgi:leader peptidase (prepilin peptidase)/N-methyltransferase
MLEVLIGSMVGATFGSTAGVALTRWSSGGSIGVPSRSSCASCRRALRVVDNIPVLSYLRLRGRCRDCGGVIDPRLLVLELSCAAMGALVMMVGLEPWVVLLVGITGCAMILATATDLERRIIPDRLTLPLAVLALPLALIGEMDRSGGGTVGLLAVSRGIALPVLSIPAGLLMLNAAGRRSGRGAVVGGGDVKLLVGLGAAAATLPQGLLLLWAGALLSSGAAAGLGVLTGRLHMKDRMAFAPFLLVGFIIAIIGAHPQATLGGWWW